MDIFVFILLTLFLLLIFGMIISAIAESFNGAAEAPMIGFTILLIILISTSGYINYYYQKSLNNKIESLNERFIDISELLKGMSDTQFDRNTQSLEICNGLLRRDIDSLHRRKEKK